MVLLSQQIFGNHIAAPLLDKHNIIDNKFGRARYRSGENNHYFTNIADFVVGENLVGLISKF